MIFKDTELLTNLYEGITNKQLNEAKHLCDCKGKCKDCETKMDLKKAGKKAIEEAKKAKKPDYLDVDEDGDEKEPLKKALKDKAMKEGLLTFKDRYNVIMSEQSNTYETDKKIWSLRKQVNPEAQYFVHYKDGTKSKPLKGESVLMTLKSKVHDIESIEPAHKE